MKALADLQAWYLHQCNGDWEHTYGVRISTLDNPGWTLDVDLIDTNLNGHPFPGHSYGVGKDSDSSGNDWLDCKMDKGKFVAAGGPEKLEEMIEVFIKWATGRPNCAFQPTLWPPGFLRAFGPRRG